MLQGQDSMQGKQSHISDIDQVTKNAALFNAIRKKPKEISEEARHKKVEKCLNEDANINAQDKNDQDNTVLHISIKNNYQEIVKFLLEKGAKINISNSEGKSPLDLAQDRQDQNLIKILTKSINVPPDGDCLFWAVALACLTPAKDDNSLFEEKYKRLFGKDNMQDLNLLQQVQNSIRNYNPFVSQEDIIHDKVLNYLVIQQFRKQVAEHMRDKEVDFKQSITGDFKQYLNKIEWGGEWGGELEIKAMSQMLECKIQVRSASTSSYGTGNDLIELYHEGLIGDRSSSSNRNHYNFGVDVKVIDSYQRTVIVQSKDTSQQGIFDALPMSHSLKRKAEDSGSMTKKSKLDEPQSSSTVDTPSILGKRKLSPSDNGNNDIPSIKRSDTFVSEPSEYSSSGLKSSLHGTIYQLKLLILFLQRGLDKEYSFRLATEMDAAEKFDDLVFQYAKKDSQGNIVGYVYRFLQAKHKQNENTKITYNDLSTENTDREFCLQKYFTSYRKIKQKPEFNKSELKDFILCTNINFDFDDLKAEGIEAKEITESDDFLEMKNVGKTAIRYKLTLNDQHELYEKLKDTSELHMLAKALVEHIKDKEQIDLKSSIFKSYHTALVQEKVIVLEKKGKKEYIGKFHERFIDYNIEDPNDPNNDPALSEPVKNLRKILQKPLFLDKIKGLSVDKDTELKLSSAFGKGFELDPDPQLIKVEEFVQELVSLIKGTKAGKEVIVGRKKQIIKDHIDKLAGHVLVEKDKKVQFSLAFLDVNSNLSGNLKDFREKFTEILRKKKIDFNTLGQYQFKITNFFTCAEGQLHLKPKLPGDYIDNKEIANFFDKLVFAVNQPNEIDLSEIIKDDFGIACNLIDSDIFADHIQKEMLDWFKAKGEKSKESRFFSNKDGKELFASTREKIDKLILVSSKLEYGTKIEKFGIAFTQDIINELQLYNFLTAKNSTQIFNLMTEYNMLSAIKVFQVLQGMTEYKKDDSYIFIRLSSLSRMQGNVIRAFRSQTSRLLVIECKEDKSIKERDIQEIHRQLSEIINSKANINKKIILITKQNDALSDLFKNDSNLANKYQETTDNKNSFTDLTTTSQKKLLEEGKIILQEYEINLNDLIDENSKELIDSETLVKLINNDEVTIGQPLISLGDTNNYYINRTLNYQTKIKTEILNAEENKDLLVISGIDKTNLSRLVPEESKICLYQEYLIYDPEGRKHIRFIILDNGQAEEQFTQLCRQYPQYTIHWLKSESGNVGRDSFIWQQSQGAISGLHQYIITDASHAKHYSETELLSQKDRDKVVIISDMAGMGKSTILTSLSQLIKQQTPNLWIVRVDLYNYTKELQEQKDKSSFKTQDIDKAIAFLTNDLLMLGTPLEQALFKHYCQKMIIMFDGFDEISPDYSETVIDLMQVLRNSGIKQLWVTTRPTEKEGLEDKLQQFVYTLEGFSKENQIEFLTKFWQQQAVSKVNQEQQEQLEIYAKALIKLLAKSISDKDTEFTGIPLQTKLLAEAFETDVTEFLSNKAELQLPEKLELIELYERFFRNKYEIQLKKSKADLSQLIIKARSEIWYSEFIEKHQNMALCTIFSEEKLAMLLNEKFYQEFSKERPKFPSHLVTEEAKKGLFEEGQQKIKVFIKDIEASKVKTGIIDQIINGKPRFIHRTFAEYLVAKFLVASLENKTIAEFVLQGILMQPVYQVLRAFFNSQLAKENLSGGVLKEYGKQIEKLWSKDRKNLYYKECNTLLHIAAEEDNVHIVSFLFDSLKEHENVLKFLLDATNNITFRKYTALCLAAKRGHLKVVQCLVENGADIHDKNNYGEVVLHWAVESGELEVVEWLVEKGADIHAKNNSGDVVLHWAVESGELEVVEWLVQKGADIHAKNNSGQTMLYWAARRDYWEVVKWLVEKGADIHAKINSSQTVLSYAAEKKEWEVVKWLVEKGADIHAKINSSQTVLSYAAEKKEWEVVKWLVEKGADIHAKNYSGQTVLHSVALSGKLEVMEWLVEKGANIHAKCNCDQPLLHWAVRSGKFEVVEWLVMKGADIHAKNRCGETVLHWAPITFKLEVVEWLVEKGADIHAKNNSGEVVLHWAVQYGKLEVVEWLVEKGADIHAKNNSGELVLHWAVRSGKLEVVEWLVEKGADIYAKNNSGEMVLQWAVKLEVVEWLVEKGADIHAKNESGEVVLHWAVQSHQLEVVEWLVEKGADIHAKNRCGETVLHMAADKANLKMVKFLVEHGADVNAKDKYGSTVLQRAAEKDQKEVVKYLIDKGAVKITDKDASTGLVGEVAD